MILGGSNDVFYFIVILLNEYLTKTHYIATLLSECLHNGVRRHACLLDLLKKYYSSLIVEVQFFLGFSY